MSETNQKGEIGELFVTLEATKKGYHVARMPQDCPYDMVIDRGNGPERVQVKYCTLKENGTINLKLHSFGMSKRRRTYTVDNVDAFAIYVPGREVFWLPASEVCGEVTTVTLRLDVEHRVAAGRKLRSDSRMADKYRDW
jgi:hypothetical protein